MISSDTFSKYLIHTFSSCIGRSCGFVVLRLFTYTRTDYDLLNVLFLGNLLVRCIYFLL